MSGLAPSAGAPAPPPYAAPALPKGGGAIRGMGEKFDVAPATGTGSMTVPIAVSPGRSGFGPQLSLSYDSAAGNGPFGLGWSLSLPAITRRTDKGLPTYRDTEGADVFILSGSEDLVPITGPDDLSTAPGFSIRRYRPRIDGVHARIERWTRSTDGDVHWRSISADNMLSIYGLDRESRIVEPDLPGSQRRVFSWLLTETRDDRGNAVVYRYKAENGDAVDLTQACEAHRGERGDPRRGTNRYLKSVHYGNATPLLDSAGRRPRFRADLPEPRWLFEVVFDYGEHDGLTPTPAGRWDVRPDPFSSYRSGFEVRTLRRCARVLMFHHIPDSADGTAGYDGLVSSTDFDYGATESEAPYSCLRSVTHRGYRDTPRGLVQDALPPLEFEYSRAAVQRDVRDVTDRDIPDLPLGLLGPGYRWVDLHGDGVPGLFTEQGGTWFYWRNLSPLDGSAPAFAPVETERQRPNLSITGRTQFLDLAGDGQLDLVAFGGPAPGLYEHDRDEGWEPFRPFTSAPTRDLSTTDVQWMDVDGDGHTDVLLLDDEAFVWHPSLAEAGFGPALRVALAGDEELGPGRLGDDRTQSVQIADMSGDGLADLVVIRNGAVWYWPNLGHGRFGAKIVMDGLVPFDEPDQFDTSRIRLADIDGSGTTDLVYLHADGARLYFNRSGNGWSLPTIIDAFPPGDAAGSVAVTDLLGIGTACLVWSSPLSGEASRPLRYVSLMGDRKPHLLVGITDNVGSRTEIRYATSTAFRLRDRRAGTPWITKVPFPVHVVERVETVDTVGRNRFVTRYAYHHGYFDGVDREFRGFAVVDQWDTGELGALTATGTLPPATGHESVASTVAPVLTRTWFHCGADVSALPPGGLPVPPLPAGLDLDEEREARRALKGSMWRQEVYGLDGSTAQDRPYLVIEHTFAARLQQRRGANRHAVFSIDPAESLEQHMERTDDARVKHMLTLEVDSFGTVVKSAVIGYGRTRSILDEPADRAVQATPLITYTETELTNGLTDPAATPDDHRLPRASQVRTFELTGYPASGPGGRYHAADFVVRGSDGPTLSFDREVDFSDVAVGPRRRRLVEWSRTRYRADDLAGLLAQGELQARALPGQNYRLAFTGELLEQVFGPDRLPDPDAVLLGAGGYLPGDESGRWWLPDGLVFYSPDGGDGPAAELDHATRHFFLPCRMRDPFHTGTVPTEAVAGYDDHDLAVIATVDAVGNRTSSVVDYRVLRPFRVTDPNGNVAEAAFDVFGQVCGTATMGRPGALTGDTLDGFDPDPSRETVRAFFADPHSHARELLGSATIRHVYDIAALRDSGSPIAAAAISRESHVDDLDGAAPAVQIGVSYCDGLGRVIQQKLQAEPDPDAAGQRWVCSGWTVHDHKGRPVRRYEPFYTAHPRFEFGVTVGVSPVVFYDPLGRTAAVVHPDHSYEKTVVTAWHTTSWDRNDTVLDDPRSDPDISGLVAGYFAALAEPDWRTWHQANADAPAGSALKDAHTKAAAHAGTPTTEHVDPLGRVFLTVSDNGSDAADVRRLLSARVELDIDGNHRALRDAHRQGGDPLGRVIMRSDYDLIGRRLRQRSMDAGSRWTLPDAAGNPLRSWDERGHGVRTEYDALRRPVRTFTLGADQAEPDREVLTERLVYGEQHPQGAQRNLRTTVYLQLDQAGALTTDARDAKGNTLQVSRRLTAGTRYRGTVDWRALDAVLPRSGSVAFDPASVQAQLAAMLDEEVWRTSTTYDALDRPVVVTAPHTEARPASLLRSRYNQGNALEAVEVSVRGAAMTPIITAIDYDAHGRRVRVRHGNGTTTRNIYDPVTSRLARLVTTRASEEIQNVGYAYDPVGNITTIDDSAQQRVFFANTVIDPVAGYTYDATYRLIEATGREHLGQNGPIAHSRRDDERRNLPHPGDAAAMGRYTETYRYDDAGNLVELKHVGTNPTSPGWTRAYDYAHPSPLEPAATPPKTTNRLTGTRLSGQSSALGYDAHGNLTGLDGTLVWDHEDRLHQADLGGGGTAYFGYDADGQRVRKVWEKPGGITEERLYLGGFEIFRRRSGAALLERETLHVMDSAHRFAIIETRTRDTDDVDRGSPQLVRHQYGNHLGSAVLELDPDAKIISYEEYSPYGSTTYQAVGNRTETPKRYRWGDKERDEETGFALHGVRYYLPWLGRWASPDPSGPSGGSNLYQFAAANPVVLNDHNGMWPSLDDVNRNVDRVNRYLTILAGPGAIAGRGLGKALGAIAGSAIAGDGTASQKAEQLANDVVVSNIPVLGTVQTVRQGVTEVGEHVEKARAAGRQGKTLDAAGHYVDAGLAGLETLTVVAGDVVAHAKAPGKLYSKVADPKAPKFTATRPTGGGIKPAPPAPRPAPKQPPLPKDSAVNAPTTETAGATYIHNRYGEAIVGGPLNGRTFEVSQNTRLDSRVADHFDATTGTLYEFNTTPWGDLAPDALKAKIDFKVAQVGKDFQLRADGTIQNVVWYGTEALPTTGEGARLARALQQANIQYQVVPLPANLTNLRPPVY